MNKKELKTLLIKIFNEIEPYLPGMDRKKFIFDMIEKWMKYAETKGIIKGEK